LLHKNEIHESSGIFHEKLVIQLAGQEKLRFLKDSIDYYPSTSVQHSNTGTVHRPPSNVWTLAVLLLQSTQSGHKDACLLKVIVKLYILDFKIWPVLNAVCFLLGNSPTSEFYMPTFRNILSVQSS
jgi:hypothetical protein